MSYDRNQKEDGVPEREGRRDNRSGAVHGAGIRRVPVALLREVRRQGWFPQNVVGPFTFQTFAGEAEKGRLIA